MTKAEEMRNYAKEKIAENTYQKTLKEIEKAAKDGAYYFLIKGEINLGVKEKLEADGFVVTNTLAVAGNVDYLVSWY